MRIAVVGAGINGVMVALKLAEAGFEKVAVFDSGEALRATSSASTKLLHGGIRYLEHGHLALVRESLRDRAWWRQEAPALTRPIEIVIPIYSSSARKRWHVLLGAKLYSAFAGRYSLGPSTYITAEKLRFRFPSLAAEGLLGGVSFYDLQMDEAALGSFMKKRMLARGVQLFENRGVSKIYPDGRLSCEVGGEEVFDLIVNAAGPWAERLNIKSNIETEFRLDTVRGSHLLFDRASPGNFLVEDPLSKRVIFVLDYFGKMLVGTTEVSQTDIEVARCSEEEVEYLLDISAQYFPDLILNNDSYQTFSGLRPILRRRKNSTSDSSKLSGASREAALCWSGQVMTIYGGKWTSSPSLAERVVEDITHKYF